MIKFKIDAETEFPRVGGLEDDPSGWVQRDKMLSTCQFVFMWRRGFGPYSTSIISPSSEGFSLSVGADFSGKPSTFRLCCTNFTYSGEHVGRVVSLVWSVSSM